MAKRNRDSTRVTAVWIWAGLALFLVVAVAARGLISRGRPAATASAPRPSDGPSAGREAPSSSGTAASTATSTAAPTSIAASQRSPRAAATQSSIERSLATQTARPRSPLERSPGYYPPNDPESLSVVTGRRDAPPVDLELTGGATSDMDLARMLLAGLNARDAGALHALRVTRREFEVILWPEFPESRPVTHITADDAWEMSNAQSLSGANRAIDGYGARQLELLGVESDPPFPYRNFMFYRGVRIVVRDQNTGEIERLKFAPSFVERHGRYKALTFKD